MESETQSTSGGVGFGEPNARVPSVTDARGGIPPGKLRAVASAIRRHLWREDAGSLAIAAIRAADEWEAQQRAAAGPQPARERDTDAWWAD